MQNQGTLFQLYNETPADKKKILELTKENLQKFISGSYKTLDEYGFLDPSDLHIAILILQDLYKFSINDPSYVEYKAYDEYGEN